ncbi:carboxylesterase family protein [Comamonas sp. CMM03]|uniref:carboxylesterase/lipase family protein n=1 Tax=Comamonas sp. CMM03 TaxID=2854781 RepID=UPI001C48E4F6|nr:carboxylesterase family protein [Comamonas sp. CMM03]MBV7417562.1 carboxylesterase family protein [Comamonas sp. CMM03]
MNKREFLLSGLKAGAVISLPGGLVACASTAGTQEPVVDTAAGKLRGLRTAQGFAFKGVPYGESTGGANRFRPPVAKQGWAGVRDATAHGASAPQPAVPLVPEFAWYWPTAATSEDSLSLAVFTPALDGKKRPVLLWLHGGGFATGAGTAPGFDGSHLAQSQDVVVVSINHRLNVFGSLLIDAPGFAPESANVGVLDQVLALRWVRENIARFGGDAGNVTIFGQSGGAAKVTALLGAPAAKGLFHKAIVQSGSGLWRLASREKVAQASHGLLQELGLDRANAARIQQLPAEQIVAAYGKLLAKTGGVSEFRPTLDGVVFPQEPYDPAGTPLAAQVPVLVGYAQQEATFFLAGNPASFALSEAQLQARVQKFLRLSGPATRELLQSYAAQYPGSSASQRLIAVASDYNYKLPTLAFADRQADLGGAPVHAYAFDWTSPARNGVLGAAHTSEVPFIFGTLDAARHLVQDSPDQLQVRDRIGAIWGQFARSGNPNSERAGVQHWSRYERGQRTTARIGKSWTVVGNPEAHARQALAQVPLYEYSFPVSFVRD